MIIVDKLAPISAQGVVKLLPTDCTDSNIFYFQANFISTIIKKKVKTYNCPGKAKCVEQERVDSKNGITALVIMTLDPMRSTVPIMGEGHLKICLCRKINFSRP